ncbi:MAG: hypothetical protein ABIB04_04050 [Patescibacteria group bacterium]
MKHEQISNTDVNNPPKEKVSATKRFSDDEQSGIREIGGISAKEQLRRFSAEHSMELFNKFQESLFPLLKQREINGDESAGRRYTVLNILDSGEITDTKRVTEATANAVERCITKSEKGDLVGFLKQQRGQEMLKIVNGELFSVIRTPQKDGTIKETLRPVKSDRRQVLERLSEIRAKTMPGIIKSLAMTYDVPVEALPFREGELNLKLMDTSHTIKSEVAFSALATIIGFDEIPPTVLKMDSHDLASLQLGVTGQPLDPKKYMELCEVKSKGDEQNSLARLACLDYLGKSSDRHPNNIRYDDETGHYFGIDNGYSLGLSEKNSDQSASSTHGMKRVPIDKYLSLPLEIVEQNPTINLSEKDRAKLKQVWDDIKTYLAYRKGALDKEEIDALPDAVKNGVAAHAIGDIFRFLHERVDENNKVIPDTKKIAKQEADDFIAKLYEISQTGRPSNLGKSLHRFDPVIRKMMERKKVAAGVR